MMFLDAELTVIYQLERNFSSYINDILLAIRQPSISKTGEGIEEMAEWLVSYLRGLGAKARKIPGQYSPIVEGDLIADDSNKTLLLYELYDTQPANGESWLTDPFDPVITNTSEGGASIVGRGAFNSKGPLVGFLTVLKAFQEANVPLPVNFRFLIEGEEEIGSPSLESYLRKKAEHLKACDAVLVPYLGTDSCGRTAIRLGFKGLMLLEMTVEGGKWGGPTKQDIHAMHSAWIASPGWELLQALVTLRDKSGDLTIDGLDRYIAGPSAEDARLLDEVARTFSPEAILAELGAVRFAQIWDRTQLFTRCMFAPSLNIDALSIGACKPTEDPATVVPKKAVAHLDLRLVPNMTVSSTLECLRAHLHRRGFEHVEVRVKSAYPWSRTTCQEPAVRSLLAACRKHSDKVSFWPLHAGAAPMYLFRQTLGLPFVFGGLGHGGRSHTANEYASLDGLKQFYRSMVSFLFEYGREKG